MKKILIIDDEPSVRKLLKRLLDSIGYKAFEAGNGHEGILQYNENVPDLVITDLIMPGKEGLETIKEMKKLNPEVQIIAISGGGVNEPSNYLKLAERLGAARTIAKPFDNEILISTIEELLH